MIVACMLLGKERRGGMGRPGMVARFAAAPWTSWAFLGCYLSMKQTQAPAAAPAAAAPAAVVAVAAASAVANAAVAAAAAMAAMVVLVAAAAAAAASAAGDDAGASARAARVVPVVACLKTVRTRAEPPHLVDIASALGCLVTAALLGVTAAGTKAAVWQMSGAALAL
eukprot:350874-Chlamydomonas_euryale.AAC.18